MIIFLIKKNLKKKQLLYFPKNIIKMNDEYALRMVERLYSANKIRKQAKINHEKIIKMGISLTKEKDKFYKKNKKAQKKK